MGLVVRCPACRGVAAVDPDARGHTVQCPRCEDTFIAVPEAELVAPGKAARNPALPRNPTLPISSSKRPERESPRYAASEAVPHSPDHDPQHHPRGQLPASVLVGFALLPFGIPILWLIAAPLFGQPPLVSIAVPIAVAISASILSLAVIYTIDWSPAIRIKGVLMLLALAYFTSVSLYFLNKDIVVWFKIHFGSWVFFEPNEKEYSVMLPADPVDDSTCKPVPNIEDLKCHTLAHDDDLIGHYMFVVGAGTTPRGVKDSDEQWFQDTAQRIVVESKGKLDSKEKVQDRSGHKGWQYFIKVGDQTRIVRLFVKSGHVYYLSIERADLSVENEVVQHFFNSFTIKR